MELGQINRIDISLDEIEKTNLIGTKESEVFEKIYAIMKEEFPELEFNETSPNLQYILYFNQIVNELEKANKAFPFFTSLHEGYAVLKEEVEEFWFEVKLLKYNETHEEMDSYLKIEKELIQIAAMALKNLHFVNEAKKTIQGKSK